MLVLALSERMASLEGPVDLLPVLRRVHVDQVDDDEAADVPEAELVDYLLHGLEVRAEHGLLQVALADVAAGVHVDGRERLALVDDQVAPGLEPDLAPQVGVDLLLAAEVVEDGRGALVELDLRLGIGDEVRDMNSCISS